MPDLDLDAIEARANAATEGPWEAQQNTYRDGYVETYFITGAECSFHALRSESDAADAEFIAYARTDVPALVAEVRRLREAEDEGDQVRSRMADLLSRVAVALNGPEPELTMWSWHDLPEKAEAQVVAKDHFAEAAALNGRQRDDWRRRYEALRDGVLAWCDEPDWSDDPAVSPIALDRLRAVVARVERGES